MARFKTLLPYAAWIAVYLGAAKIIGDMTRQEIPVWYRGLSKPDLNPPDIVFPIAWTILYIMIAIAGCRIWKSGNKPAKILFALQTVLNWAWSYWFFYFHHLGLSVAWILVLIVVVAALMTKTARTDMALLTPYLFWLCFAAYLNFMIWQLN